MEQSQIWKPALIGGVLLGILSAVPPFSCACCAWIIGGGILAAYLYVRSSPVVVTLGNGVLLGLLTGAIGGVVDTIFSIPVQILMRSYFEQYGAQMRQMLNELSNLPPALRSFLEAAPLAQLGPLTVIVSLFFNVVIYGLIAMLGGALGVAIFEKRKVEPPSPTYPSPPPVSIPPPPAPPPDMPS